VDADHRVRRPEDRPRPRAPRPWAVATIVALTERGFYDGLTFHRDVPGFVLQGGDPEGTGWGGPGFTLPSEPSHHRFDRGAVGIADAGKDTGGSQFFFMHDRAPHLEGRYTWVGELHPRHHALLPLLTVGDRIVRATVTIRPARRSDAPGAARCGAHFSAMTTTVVNSPSGPSLSHFGCAR
jgi:cyclophilin family peptidyl-prolyl cis-trans isomerase